MVVTRIGHVRVTLLARLARTPSFLCSSSRIVSKLNAGLMFRVAAAAAAPTSAIDGRCCVRGSSCLMSVVRVTRVCASLDSVIVGSCEERSSRSAYRGTTMIAVEDVVR